MSPRRLCLPAMTLSLILVSGCSTMPAAAPPRPPAKPVICLKPVAGRLQLLPAGFEDLAPGEKARVLLTLHAMDGEAYGTAVTELRDCQGWIRGQP